MHYYLADQEARLVDPEASALLLDLEGNVAETSAANFLMVVEGTIVSPSLRNTLPGVSRATVVELAAKLQIPFEVRDFQPFDAINADECFLASTPYCLMPVTKMNGIPIGEGRPGPIYRRLVDAWSQMVGIDVVAQLVAAPTDGRPRRDRSDDKDHFGRLKWIGLESSFLPVWFSWRAPPSPVPQPLDIRRSQSTWSR